MKIVITDGHTLNPGDLDWEPFKQFGAVQIHQRTLPVEAIARCFDADIIVTNKTLIDANVMDAAGHLKMIAVTATGYNNVDIVAAKSRSVLVCNVPGYGTHSVAQHVFALLLELCNHVGRNAASVAKGEWAAASDWSYSLDPIVEIHGKTIGIIGMGKIGRQVAAVANAFGMQVLYHGGHSNDPYCKEASLYELFMQSDFISLHCPLTTDNAGFVNKELLGLMKPAAYLINTARGALINEKELAQVLWQKKIAGAALDVLSAEPPEKDHPLIGLSNCIVTPHNAWMSAAARQRVMDCTLQNVRAFLQGAAQHVVN